MKTNRQPFQDIVDTSIFFGGGTRREIVDDIKAAFNDEAVLLTLTGTDGSGKTMICRMIEQELKADAELLFFDQGTESFDELVDRITTQVGLEDTEEMSDRKTRLEKAVEILGQQNRRLIIILDGAENIFLATLERIRRMIDQVNTERLSIQLLLSGRPLFSLNFKQLGIITFKRVKEKHFSLDPLDGKDTHLYLNHCLDVADTDERKRFSLAQAEEIADIARGNFKLINQLAGKFLDLKRLASQNNTALENAYDDEATDSPGIHSRLSAGLGNVDLDFLKVPKIGVRWYAAAGAAIVALILIIVLFRGEDDEEIESISGSDNVPELTLEKVEPDPIEIPQPSQPVEPLQPPPAAVTPEEPQNLVEKVRPSEVVSELVEETAESSSPEVVAEIAEPSGPEVVEEEADKTAAAVRREAEHTVQQTPLPEATQSSENLEEQVKSQETQEERADIAEASPVQVKGDDTAEELVSEDDGPDASSELVTVEAPSEQRQEVAEAQNLSEKPREIDNSASSESLKIPKLTVLTKKKPPTEPVPSNVVTLKSESKKKPDQLATSATPSEPESVQRNSAQSVSEEPQSPPAEEKQVEPVVADRQPERVASVDETVVNDSNRQVDAKDSGVYYAKRLAAGSRWLVGGSRDKYTVQLMVLNSEDAQENVRYMLSDESYQPIMDQLYILRRSGQPQTVMLYWGEFDSPAEARQGKDQLPAFLSRLEPFEIPVKDAVIKARAGQ